MPTLSRRLVLAAAALAMPRLAAAAAAPPLDLLRLFVPAAPGGAAGMAPRA
jgi:tripartite-type tricarboxylate transporter receptor subunit TctC